MSDTAPVSCEVADATDCTLTEASSEAWATIAESRCVVSAFLVRVLAAASSPLEAMVSGGYLVSSWLGLFTVIGAVMLLMKLRARLRESVT